MVVTGQGGPVVGVSFKAPKPACMGSAVWIADVWQQPIVLSYYGNTQHKDGVETSIDCVPTPPIQAPYLPLYLGWIWYSVAAPASNCCAYAPEGILGDPTPVLRMCEDFVNRPVQARGLVVNPDATCRCDIPVGTKQTTWGAVKALYH
jgi:hypothetical protein